MSTLGERLRQARENRGWSQTYVAGKTGVKNASLSNYERDYRKPDPETLAILADFYGVDLHFIITGEDPPSSRRNIKKRR